MTLDATILALGPVGYWLTNCPDEATAANDLGSGNHDGVFYNGRTMGQAALTIDGDTSATFGTGGVLSPNLSAAYNPSGDYSLTYWFASTASDIRVATGLYGSSNSYWSGLLNTKVTFSYNNAGTLDSPSTYNDGQVHCVVAVRSGTTVNLYIDGSLVNSVSGVSTAAYVPEDVFCVGNFGKTSVGNAYPFTGRLAKVAYFDKALSATDAASIWTAGTTGGGSASIAASPTSVQAGRKAVSIALTGTGTAWTTGTTFTVTGGAKVSQSVASGTSATVVVDVGYSTGTLAINDGSVSANVSIVVPYTIADATAGGQDVRVLVPWNYDSGTQTPVVMYHHGAGETAASLTSDALKQGVVNALCGSGYIVCSSTAAGENWGNQAGLDAYSALYGYVASGYNVGRLVHFSQSMGGFTGLLTFAGVDDMARTKGWFGIYPACNLANLYGLGTFAGEIRAAYGIASDGSDYASKTADHDPALLPGATYRNRMMRFYASTGDTVVPEAQNTDAMRTLVGPYAREYGLVECTGDHGDPSHFQPDDVLAFVSRALASPPALASLVVPADGMSVVLTFAEDVLPATGVAGFGVTVDGTATSITASRTAGNAITLAVPTAIQSGQSVSVSYSSGNVTDVGSIPLDDFTTAATNGSTASTVAATGSIVVGAVAASGSSGVRVSATGSLAVVAIAAGGSSSTIVGATGGLAIAGLAMAGSSQSTVLATGSMAVAGLTAAGTAGVRVGASGSLGVAGVVFAGSSVARVNAAGTLDVGSIAASGSVGVRVAATGGLAVGAIDATALGTPPNDAVGSIVVGPVATMGSTGSTIVASGVLVVGDVSASGASVFYVRSDPFAASLTSCVANASSN